MKKVLIGLSGGVDSSVAIHILQNQGYEVVACTLDLIEKTDVGKDAREVADSFGCRHYMPDYREKFSEIVIKNFAETYEAGLTPNPCVYCNRHLKFAALLEEADRQGIEYIATGHYARVEQDVSTGRYLLKKGKDLAKDQSYMLYNLTQEQLSRVIFPLGEITKNEIRDIASDLNLSNADKKDSQDICFVPDGDYAGFLEMQCGIVSRKGDFVDTEGNKIGEHRGLVHYTVGQRKGLGQTFGKPMYVIGKDKGTNTVSLGENQELMSRAMLVKDVNLISVADVESSCRVLVKARYAMKEESAEIFWQGEYVKVVFDCDQRALTPGQAAVFYDMSNPDVVLGGGTILCSLEV